SGLRHTVHTAAELADDPEASPLQVRLQTVVDSLVGAHDAFAVPPLPPETVTTETLLELKRDVDHAWSTPRGAETAADPEGLPRYLRGYRAPVRRELTDGSIVGPPDFIGVGAQKSGTSWWHNLIDQHPDVVNPDLPYKEGRIFSSPEWRPGMPFDPEWYAER